MSAAIQHSHAISNAHVQRRYCSCILCIRPQRFVRPPIPPTSRPSQSMIRIYLLVVNYTPPEHPYDSISRVRLPLLNHTLRHSLLRNPLGSKVRHPPVITPIPTISPPQRFVLRPTNLSRLGVDIALEFRWCTSSHVGMKLFALFDLLAILKPHLYPRLWRRVGRLVDLRAHR